MRVGSAVPETGPRAPREVDADDAAGYRAAVEAHESLRTAS